MSCNYAFQPTASLRGLTALAFLAASSHSVAADKVCAPAQMLKVVTTIDAPGIPAGHFMRVPKTLYRLGDGKGRIEEARNPESGLHLLIVVDEPHVWVVNLAQRQGRYQRDPGPTFYFRARLFGDPSVASAFIRNLEIGCEVAWMREAGIKTVQTVHPTLGSVNKMEFIDNQERLILFERNGNPVSVELYGPAGWVMSMNYLTYEANLNPDKRLFSRPEGVAFVSEESGK